MGLRFRKTFSLFPGVRLNVGKKSASVRVGVKGFGYTIGTAGKTISASLPGSGLSLRHKFKSDTARPAAAVSERRRPWLLLFVIYACAGLIWWTILQPN